MLENEVDKISETMEALTDWEIMAVALVAAVVIFGLCYIVYKYVKKPKGKTGNKKKK